MMMISPPANAQISGDSAKRAAPKTIPLSICTYCIGASAKDNADISQDRRWIFSFIMMTDRVLDTQRRSENKRIGRGYIWIRERKEHCRVGV